MGQYLKYYEEHSDHRVHLELGYLALLFEAEV